MSKKYLWGIEQWDIFNQKWEIVEAWLSRRDVRKAIKLYKEINKLCEFRYTKWIKV